MPHTIKSIFAALAAFAALSVSPKLGVSSAARCIAWQSAGHTQQPIAVASGDHLRLRFRHSIYGSQVEEIFAVTPQGFTLSQLRYGEARLVEFYGHERAIQENGTWVVTPNPVSLPTLTLRLSDDAAATLRIEGAAGALDLALQPDTAHRFTLASCTAAING